MRTWEYPEPGRDRLNARHTGSTSGRIPVRNPRTCSVQDKGDAAPAQWMPPNAAFHCQYAMQFIAVLRGYALPVDQASTGVLRQAAATCPTG